MTILTLYFSTIDIYEKSIIHQPEINFYLEYIERKAD